MHRTFMVAMLALAVVFAMVFGYVSDVSAGQFKTLNTAGLRVGGQISALSSPKNTEAVMELEVYEWPSRVGGGNYRCRILRNTTGQTLNLALIGVNATIINFCAAPNNGTCNTPTVGLVSNLKFMCIVATQNGAPVNSTAHYIVAVQRQ